MPARPRALLIALGLCPGGCLDLGGSWDPTSQRALVTVLAGSLFAFPCACSSEEESVYDCQLDKSEVSISGETLHGSFIAEQSLYLTSEIPSDVCTFRSYVVRFFENEEDAPFEEYVLDLVIDGLTLGTNKISYRYIHGAEWFYGEAVVDIVRFRLPEEEPFGVIAGVLTIDDEQVSVQGSFVAPFCIDLSSDCVSDP